MDRKNESVREHVHLVKYLPFHKNLANLKGLTYGKIRAIGSRPGHKGSAVSNFEQKTFRDRFLEITSKGSFFLADSPAAYTRSAT